jgi:hypothetical protein
MKMKRITLNDEKGRIGVYELQKPTAHKRLRKFLNIGCGIYAMNNVGCGYYWCDGYWYGDWFTGGYYVSPFIHHFCDVFADLKTGEIFKLIKHENN